MGPCLKEMGRGVDIVLPVTKINAKGHSGRRSVQRFRWTTVVRQAADNVFCVLAFQL